jgi:hypothetical protein
MAKHKKNNSLVKTMKIFKEKKEEFLEKGKKIISEEIEKLLKEFLSFSKKKIIKDIEKRIEASIRRAVQKVLHKVIALTLFALSAFFIFYALIDILVTLSTLPNFLTPLLFGLLLLIGALITYLSAPKK